MGYVEPFYSDKVGSYMKKCVWQSDCAREEGIKEKKEKKVIVREWVGVNLKVLLSTMTKTRT